MRVSKYKAIPTEVNGRRFSSKLEAAYYEKLLGLQQSGQVKGILLQPAFYFASGIKYVADFQVFYPDGTSSFIDVKGMETPAFKMKKKLLAQEYPWVNLEIVKKV